MFAAVCTDLFARARRRDDGGRIWGDSWQDLQTRSQNCEPFPEENRGL